MRYNKSIVTMLVQIHTFLQKILSKNMTENEV